MNSTILILTAMAGLGALFCQSLSLMSSAKPNDKPDEKGFLSAVILDEKGNDFIATSKKRDLWAKFSIIFTLATVILPLVPLISRVVHNISLTF